jgi:hypothetical protein
MYRVIWNAVRFQQESLLHGPGKRVGIETSIRLARPDDDSLAALANAGFVLSDPENGVT